MCAFRLNPQLEQVPLLDERKKLEGELKRPPQLGHFAAKNGTHAPIRMRGAATARKVGTQVPLNIASLA